MFCGQRSLAIKFVRDGLHLLIVGRCRVKGWSDFKWNVFQGCQWRILDEFRDYVGRYRILWLYGWLPWRRARFPCCSVASAGWSYMQDMGSTSYLYDMGIYAIHE